VLFANQTIRFNVQLNVNINEMLELTIVDDTATLTLRLSWSLTDTLIAVAHSVMVTCA
jgi:hypothetical protein